MKMLVSNALKRSRKIIPLNPKIPFFTVIYRTKSILSYSGSSKNHSFATRVPASYLSHKRAFSVSPQKSKGFTNLKKIGIVIAISGALYFLKHVIIENHQKKVVDLALERSSDSTVDIGGDWQLTDQEGVQRSARDFEGKIVLYYFGFTHCPEICPRELRRLEQIFQRVKENSAVTPIFVSLDPERDTPETLKTYFKDYPKIPNLVALTGDRKAVDEAAKAFKVYHQKVPGSGEDYNIDHSTYMFLMDEHGVFKKLLHSSDDVSECADAINDAVRARVPVDKPPRSVPEKKE